MVCRNKSTYTNNFLHSEFIILHSEFKSRLRQIGVVFATCCKKSEGPSLWRATESWTHVRKEGSSFKTLNSTFLILYFFNHFFSFLIFVIVIL